MIDPAILFALGLGLLIGAWAGANAGIRLAERRRRALGTHAQLARLWPTTLPARSAADILAGVIRIALGGRVYEVPVLPRNASRKWLAELDARFASLASEMDKAGDDVPTIMVRLVAEADGLYDMLLSYDRAGRSVLPSRADIDDVATDTEILRAMLEVWRAANPLAATLAEPPEDGQTGMLRSTPPSTPPPHTGGARLSLPASPTSSSSPTSTPRTTDSPTKPRSSSSGSSKPSASARASSTTAKPTAAGAASSTPARRSRPATARA